MKEEIFNPEDVKNEFIQNTLPEYGRTYSKQQLDLAIYMLTDFVNNLSGNDLYLIRITEEPEPQQPVYQAPPQQPVYQPPQMQRRVVQQQQPVYQQPNPFQEEVGEQQIRDYSDPRTQRMRVDDYAVQREVEEMNAQLRTPQPPRMQPQQRPMMQQQPMQQPVQDVNLTSEKSKTFVDKIKEMRNPRKKEGINPEE